MTIAKYVRIILLLLQFCCVGCTNNEPSVLFQELSADVTKITFANSITVSDTLNILDYNYFYNGGGVAAADFNNDNLTDLFFTGNQVTSRLYLNKGNFSFSDITEVSGVGTSNWATGVAVADINNDGFLDMYVSYAGHKQPERRTHQLFINQGVTKEGIPQFKDEAERYGVADTSYTTQSAFIDYDRDGDLDLLLANHYQDFRNPNYPTPKLRNGASPSNMKLYRNEGARFTEVSRQAGILDEGFSLSVTISDINNDNWPDFYVAKDFVFDDALYINNKNGTFTESINKYLGHTSQFSMGSDIADFNNDGLSDIVVVDMLPTDNKRQKLMNIAMNNDRFNQILSLGYMPQYSRNMLQLNNGPDASGQHSFSEIGQLSGIHKTDWSWSPLFADLDNDGWKDLYITNGIPRDITNNDFITYRAQKIMSASNTDHSVLKKEMLDQIESLEPVDKTNFAFRNNGNLRFTDVSVTWGLAKRGFSNGAVYADLDNDGDLDLVTNNLNSTASVYKNNSSELTNNHWLRVKLQGAFSNGAKLLINAGAQTQLIENTTCRGFQSSQEPIVHFGLGSSLVADTLRVVWLDGSETVLHSVKADTVLSIAYDNAHRRPRLVGFENKPVPLFTNITESAALKFTHEQKPFEDFNHEPLLPHRFSSNGPHLALADVDNNGYEDLWIGGPAKVPGRLFLQQPDGRFVVRNMPDSGYEDMGAVFFDADGDKDPDLYVVSGGNAYNAMTAAYQDRLYTNDGKGNFQLATQALPPLYSSGSVVVENDFDKDGDLDLFVGGRVYPGRYPFPPESYILRNDGHGNFQNATQQVSPGLAQVGMVTCALWNDFDRDGWTDLIIAGEWMPVSLYRNNKGNLESVEKFSGDEQLEGWWFSLAADDFDRDGDTDIIAGNLGLNNKYNASPQTPLSVYAKDFDGNGNPECVLTYYINDEEQTVPNLDQMTSVLPGLRKTFNNYTKFSEASFKSVFLGNQLHDALKLRVNSFGSVYMENKGNGEFSIRQLPVEAQFSAIQSIVVDDFDNDGHQDALVGGNFFSPDFMTGRYDASIGLLLKGNGKGNFSALSAAASGIRIRGDVRCLKKFSMNKKSTILAAVNRGPLQVFQHK
jgi:enediyne biosynthesis protein E4